MNKLIIKKIKIIVSTDLLSRGIDNDNIDLVIHFDIPTTIETYFHRIGRTGRFGKYGVSFLLSSNHDLNFFEKYKNVLIKLNNFDGNYSNIN